MDEDIKKIIIGAIFFMIFQAIIYYNLKYKIKSLDEKIKKGTKKWKKKKDQSVK